MPDLRDTFRGCRTHALSAQAGMTLIEMIIVLAIIAVIAAATAVSTGGMSNNAVRSAALHTSGAMRLTYGRAAINGIRYQFVIDLDDNSYRVECSDDNVLIDPEAEDGEPQDEDEDDEADPFGLGAQVPSMADCSEPLLEQHTLRSGTQFARVLTTHHSEPVEEGQATIAFFPNGFVERSLIWISDEDGEAWVTLVIDPMTGRVRTEAGELEVPDDFFSVEED